MCVCVPLCVYRYIRLAIRVSLLTRENVRARKMRECARKRIYVKTERMINEGEKYEGERGRESLTVAMRTDDER